MSEWLAAEPADLKAPVNGLISERPSLDDTPGAVFECHVAPGCIGVQFLARLSDKERPVLDEERPLVHGSDRECDDHGPRVRLDRLPRTVRDDEPLDFRRNNHTGVPARSQGVTDWSCGAREFTTLVRAPRGHDGREEHH